MNEEEIQALTSELGDINTACIFLNEGLWRTQDLKKCPTKHGFPDLDNRIKRIQTAYDRFFSRSNEITRILIAEEKAVAAKKAYEKREAEVEEPCISRRSIRKEYER